MSSDIAKLVVLNSTSEYLSWLVRNIETSMVLNGIANAVMAVSYILGALFNLSDGYLVPVILLAVVAGASLVTYIVATVLTHTALIAPNAWIDTAYPSQLASITLTLISATLGAALAIVMLIQTLEMLGA